MSERDEILASAAARFGTPCYVYFTDEIDRAVGEVRNAFGPGWAIGFAVKSNPNAGILRHLCGKVDLLDVSSPGEIRRGLAAGWTADRLSLTGPAKSDLTLRAAVATGVDIVVESVAEARRLDAVARAAGRKVDILLRVAPARVPPRFGAVMAGRASPFGVDEEQAAGAVRDIMGLSGVELRGFHALPGTQCLDPDAVTENLLNCAQLFRSLAADHDITPSRLIFGSGFGIPYHEGDRDLDVKTVAAATGGPFRDTFTNARFGGTQFVLEMGRYLVGKSGFYVVRVIETKRSHGVDIAVCDGGMNHNLAACGLLGSVLHRPYPMFRVGGGDATSTYNVVGPLCTGIDILGRRIPLPVLKPGDLIAVGCSGAYGLTASPVNFISHRLPAEAMVRTADGTVRLDDVSGTVAASPHSP